MPNIPVRVLVYGRNARGPIRHARIGERVPPGCVAVVPCLSPAYWEATLGAAAVITERGGIGSHTADLLREEGTTLIRLENARQLLREGKIMVLDNDKHEYEMLP